MYGVVSQVHTAVTALVWFHTLPLWSIPSANQKVHTATSVLLFILLIPAFLHAKDNPPHCQACGGDGEWHSTHRNFVSTRRLWSGNSRWRGEEEDLLSCRGCNLSATCERRSSLVLSDGCSSNACVVHSTYYTVTPTISSVLLVTVSRKPIIDFVLARAEVSPSHANMHAMSSTTWVPGSTHPQVQCQSLGFSFLLLW